MEIADGNSLAGGGSTPSQSLPSKVIESPAPGTPRQNWSSASARARRIRDRPHRDDRLILDLRTVFPDQEPLLIKALAAVLPSGTFRISFGPARASNRANGEVGLGMGRPAPIFRWDDFMGTCCKTCDTASAMARNPGFTAPPLLTLALELGRTPRFSASLRPAASTAPVFDPKDCRDLEHLPTAGSKR